MPSTSELITRRKALLTLMTLRVILDALGLPGSVPFLTTRDGMHSVMSDVILEAEMVAFSDTTGSIDGKLYPWFPHFPMLSCASEFWRIRSLVESTAVGPRHKVRKTHEEVPVM